MTEEMASLLAEPTPSAISAELRQKIMSDCEIISLTKDIVGLRKEEQDEFVKERIEMLEKLRMEIGLQYLEMED